MRQASMCYFLYLGFMGGSIHWGELLVMGVCKVLFLYFNLLPTICYLYSLFLGWFAGYIQPRTLCSHCCRHAREVHSPALVRARGPVAKNSLLLLFSFPFHLSSSIFAGTCSFCAPTFPLPAAQKSGRIWPTSCQLPCVLPWLRSDLVMRTVLASASYSCCTLIGLCKISPYTPLFFFLFLRHFFFDSYKTGWLAAVATIVYCKSRGANRKVFFSWSRKQGLYSATLATCG